VLLPNEDDGHGGSVTTHSLLVNQETLPLATMESMQFGHALDHILREILLPNINHSHVYLNKIDLSEVLPC
jgi:hypothetical protein